VSNDNNFAAVQMYLLREGFFTSAAIDLFTFGTLCAAVWFNQTYCGGSWFLNGVVLVCWLTFVLENIFSGGHVFTSKEALIKYLQETK
jgi:hypothetical protein